MNVVITGSTKGIGFGLAREFLAQGHNVAISGQSEQSVNDALAKLATNSAKVVGTACNVAVKTEVENLAQQALASFGSIDIWINNAGLARTTWAIKDIPQSEIETMVTTNMLGGINGCRTAIDAMSENGGKIFNMLGGGSDGEYFPGMGIYGTTKRGLDYFTNALVTELKDSNIIVAKIRPGMIITEAVIREAKADLENFNNSRAIMNNMVDKIETVAPFLVEEILATTKPGRKIRWLTGTKIGIRMLKGRFKKRPDQFEEFGL
jgi:NAD(P)-dependent dehydrogenase (short-subunit alcohol dehydrogenase family)